MCRTACWVTRANTSSRSSVNNALENRSAPYASSSAAGTTMNACSGVIVNASMTCLNTIGTLTLAPLAAIKQASASRTRPL